MGWVTCPDPLGSTLKVKGQRSNLKVLVRLVLWNIKTRTGQDKPDHTIPETLGWGDRPQPNLDVDHEGLLSPEPTGESRRFGPRLLRFKEGRW